MRSIGWRTPPLPSSFSFRDTAYQNWAKSTFFATLKHLTLSDDKTTEFLETNYALFYYKLNSLQLYLYAFLSYLQH